MKTCTTLCHSLLLVAMMVVSWAAGVPLQDTQSLQDIHSEEQLQMYMENNPSIVDELYPDLLREASEVFLVVDPDVVVDMLRRKEAEAVQEEQDQEQSQEETQQQQGEEHHRRKRQTTTTFDYNRQRGPFGTDHQASGSINRDFNSGRSSLSASAQHNWGASGRNTQASVGFNHRFNRGRSSVGVNANRSWGDFGRSHGFGVSFRHRFGR